MRSSRITDASTLGLVLREARMSRGLSQRELADRMGIAQSYLVGIESGKPTKAVERLLEFARETGIALYAESDDD